MASFFVSRRAVGHDVDTETGPLIPLHVALMGLIDGLIGL